MGARNKLTRDDWLKAGQAVLRQTGIASLKLQTLTEKLHVSTGSFYHHFNDFDDYLAQLARHFDVEEVKQVAEAARKAGGTPIERIRRIGQITLKVGLFRLDAAMRVWASHDKRAEAAVRRAEKVGLDYITDAFRDMGFDNETAAFRAKILLSVNVARVHFDPQLSNNIFPDEVLAYLTKDAPAPEGKRTARMAALSS
jgi:AcrR family transcriptional regulator